MYTPAMAKRNYYRRWASHVLGVSWHVSDTLSSIGSILAVPILIPLVKRFFPAWEQGLTDLAWLPLVAFIGLITVRVFLAPYWIDQEREQEINSLKDTPQQIESALRQQLAELKAQLDTRAVRREQRETLAYFIETGTRSRQTYETREPVPKTVAEQWETAVYGYLKMSFGLDYAVRFQRPNMPFLLNSRPPHISEENYKLYLFISMRLEQLEGFIKELT
jgi:hypothetical protein